MSNAADENTPDGAASDAARVPPREPSPPANEVAERAKQRVTAAERALATLLEPDESADRSELIHDYRVALRRLRSVLRPLGLIYGKKKTRALADRLREIANVTGDLRDEEVLRETLADLTLDADGDTKEALGRWMAGRTRREQGLRARVTRQIRRHADEAGGIRELCRDVNSLLSRAPKHELTPAALSEAALDDALAAIERRSEAASAHDVQAMHRLRIGYKRLRYTLELVEGLLDFDAVNGAKLAAKQQKLLGRLHDLDEALVRVGRARGLAHGPRTHVLAALKKARHKCERKAAGEAETAFEAVSAWRRSLRAPAN